MVSGRAILEDMQIAATTPRVNRIGKGMSLLLLSVVRVELLVLLLVLLLLLLFVWQLLEEFMYPVGQLVRHCVLLKLTWEESQTDTQ